MRDSGIREFRNSGIKEFRNSQFLSSGLNSNPSPGPLYHSGSVSLRNSIKSSLGIGETTVSGFSLISSR